MPDPSKPYVIAEAGNCHEGSLETAIELVHRAREAGADFIKFQAGRAEGFARLKEDIPRYRRYELGFVGYKRLAAEAFRCDIDILFSVWNEEFDELRTEVGGWFKIPARQCDPDVIRFKATPKTFISIPHWYDEAQVRALGITQGIPLHCVTEYPAQDAQLPRLGRLRQWLGMDVGYSDHTVGIDNAIAAVKQGGAIAVEKHFTLAHDFGPLRDHALAATPVELKQLVEAVKG